MPNTLQLFNGNGATHLVADENGDLSLFSFDQSSDQKRPHRLKMLTVEGEIVFEDISGDLLALKQDSINLESLDYGGLSKRYCNSTSHGVKVLDSFGISDLLADGLHLRAVSWGKEEMHINYSKIRSYAFGGESCQIGFTPDQNEFKFFCLDSSGIYSTGSANLIVDGRIMDTELRGNSIPTIKKDDTTTPLEVTDLSGLVQELGYTPDDQGFLTRTNTTLPLDMSTVTMTSLMDIIVRLTYNVQTLSKRVTELENVPTG